MLLVSIIVGFFVRYKVEQKRRYIEIPEYGRSDVADNFSGGKIIISQNNFLGLVDDAKVKKIEECK